MLVNLALVLGAGLGLAVVGPAGAPARQRAGGGARGGRRRASASTGRTGVVRAVLPEIGIIVVTHGEIPGYMPPMTMGFRAASPKILESVEAGRRGTIHVAGHATQPGDHRDREEGALTRAGRIVREVVSQPARRPRGCWLAAAPAAAATLFVTNTKSDSISVIDTTTFEVIGTIPLGRGKPNRVVFHPDGKTAWVVYDKSHDLGVVDADARKLVRRVKIGGNPYNLAFTPDGRHLLVLDWASDTSSDEVIFYDLRREKIDGRVEVSTWPAHSVFSRDGRLLYVSGETAGDLTVIDVAKREIVARDVHGGGDAMGLALTADGSSLYAAAGENKSVVKIDTATNKPVGHHHPARRSCTRRRSRSTASSSTRRCARPTRSWSSDTATTRSWRPIPQKGYPDLVTMEPTGRYALVTNRWADHGVRDRPRDAHAGAHDRGRQGAARHGAPPALTVPHPARLAAALGAALAAAPAWADHPGARPPLRGLGPADRPRSSSAAWRSWPAPWS